MVSTTKVLVAVVLVFIMLAAFWGLSGTLINEGDRGVENLTERARDKGSTPTSYNQPVLPEVAEFSTEVEAG